MPRRPSPAPASSRLAHTPSPAGCDAPPSTCHGQATVSLTKRKLIQWLLAHDFEELPRRATSHRRFRGPGTTITVPAHGRLELSAKHAGMLVRELEKAGFERDQVREELGL
jgi:predicted RNA binding protein YcfA (HicA-like mRNA interferase family)